MADLQPGAWIESYEMAMELLEVSDAAMAKYFTMMLDGTARTWLKGLPPPPQFHWLMGGIKSPVHSELQGHMQTTYVNRGPD